MTYLRLVADPSNCKRRITPGPPHKKGLYIQAFVTPKAAKNAGNAKITGTFRGLWIYSPNQVFKDL